MTFVFPEKTWDGACPVLRVDMSGEAPFPHRGISIMASVAYSSGLSVGDIRGKSRASKIVSCRWDVVRTLYDKGYGLSEIARLINRHHTTVLHGLKQRPSQK